MNIIHRHTVQLITEAFAFINKDASAILPSYVPGTQYDVYVADVSMLCGASIIYLVTINSDSAKHGFQCEGGRLELGASKEQWILSLRETMDRLFTKIIAS